MTESVRKKLKSAKANKEFLHAIYEADKDKPPGIFASDIEEHLFVVVYYGWLVGKYGNDWRDYL